MSEKLYKVVKAVDLFDKDNPIPKRYLVFEHQNGNQIEVYFPEDRTTLFFRDELYDWYGHKVKLSDDIVRIIKPFGYTSSSDPQEKFLVRIEGQRFALATLCHKCKVSVDGYTVPCFKHKLLHGVFASYPILKCYSWSFQRIVNLDSTCFSEHFDTKGQYVAFVGVEGRDSIGRDNPSLKDYIRNLPEKFNFSSIKFTSQHTYDHPLEHRVMASREEALNLHWTFGGPNIACVESNYLLGDLEISKHGEKLTARSPIPDKYGNTRVSTDSEVIKHLALYDKNRLYWYYDPEP